MVQGMIALISIITVLLSIWSASSRRNSF